MEPTNAAHPGTLLKERFLDPLGITPYRLAKAIGVHVRRVSELVKGNRSLTPDTALRLALFFDVPALWWLNMQAEYDAAQAENLSQLKRIVQPYDGLQDILLSPQGVTHLGAATPAPAKPSVAFASPDFLEKLKRQVDSSRERAPRSVRTVHYENGSTALVGDSG